MAVLRRVFIFSI